MYSPQGDARTSTNEAREAVMTVPIGPTFTSLVQRVAVMSVAISGWMPSLLRRLNTAPARSEREPSCSPNAIRAVEPDWWIMPGAGRPVSMYVAPAITYSQP